MGISAVILQAVPDWNTLTIVVGAASASAIAGFAVSRQISSLGKEHTANLAALGEKFMAALAAHKDEDSEKFHDHALRLGKIDLRLEGYTHSGKNPDRMDVKYPRGNRE